MLKTISFAAAVALAAGASPGLAQSWGFGVGVDTRIPIYGPPPVYYEPQEPTYYYEAPPQVLYGAPPVVLVPGERRIFRMEAPELVLDRLNDAGYRDLGPMARRGSLYKLTAVAPEGDVVALEISIFTGEIERERVLQPRRQQPSRTVVAPRRTRTAAVPAPDPAPDPAPSVAAPAAEPPVAGPGGPASTLRDRLKPVPGASEEQAGGDDPLVVY